MTPATRSRPSRRAVVGGGVVAVAVYVLVAVLTLGSGHTVRPLFEGVGPPPTYQWVNPPARFASGNVKPTKTDITILFDKGVSVASTLASLDGSQFLASVPVGGIAPKAGDTSVKVTITPLDPATLGAVPAGLVPDGNAYRVDLAYQPSGQPVTQLSTSSGVVLAAPSLVQALLYSSDGQTWERQDVNHTTGNSTATGTWQKPGIFVAAGPPDSTLVGGSAPGSDSRPVVLVVALTLLLALGLGLGPVAFRRWRGKRSPPRSGPKAGDRRPSRPRSSTPPLRPGQGRSDRPKKSGGQKPASQKPAAQKPAKNRNRKRKGR